MKYTVSTLIAGVILAASSGLALAEDNDGFGIHYPKEIRSTQSSAQPTYNLTPGKTNEKAESIENNVQFGIQSPLNDVLTVGEDG
jgi:hypothetical protein